jgi:hypothetical protein
MKTFEAGRTQVMNSAAVTPNLRAGAVEITVARSVEEVEALRPAWVSWPGHRDSDIDFYLMIVRSYREVLRPYVIALYRDGRPDAILVGRLERKRISFPIGYLRGLPIQAKCLRFVYGGIHGDESLENVRALAGEVVSRLAQGEADLAMLEFVPLETTLYQIARSLPGIFCRDSLSTPQRHRSMTIPDKIEQVYGMMSGHRRKVIRQCAKRLRGSPAGEPRIKCYRMVSDFDRLFHDVEEIARKTYQRGLGAGFADTPDVRARLQLAVDKGWLRAYVLYLGSRPCAFWIGMSYGDAFLSEYMGYDPEFRDLSPGMFLIMSVLEGFCDHAEGDLVRRVDWGLGDAEYKEVLSDNAWLEANVYVFAPSVKGLALKSVRVATELIVRSARHLLSSTGLSARIKRLWRNHLAKRSQTAAPCVSR